MMRHFLFKKISLHVRLNLKQIDPLKSNLNHTHPIKNKSDFCLTKTQRREREKGKRDVEHRP